MDETAQGRVKSPNYRSASQLYDAGYKEYITDLSYVYLVNPPRMLCAPTQPLRAGRDFWWVCIEEEQSLPIPSRPGKLALVDPQRKTKEHALWYLENLIRYDYTRRALNKNMWSERTLAGPATRSISRL